MMARLNKVLSRNWLFLLVVMALLAALALLRSHPTDLADVAAFEVTTSSGIPSIVEFYSNR